MTKLSSRERLLRTIKGEPTDRIPIVAPLPWELPMMAREGFTGWQAEPNFRAVAELALEHGDFFYPMSSTGWRIGSSMETSPLGYLDRRFLLVPDEYIEVSEEKRGARTVSTYTVHTPRGDLCYVEAREDDMDTSWVVEPLLKDKDDVDKILSVPFSFTPPDLDPYREEEAALGDAGLPTIAVSTPMVCASHPMAFDQFLMWCAVERATVIRLIEAAFERIYVKLEWLLQHGVGPDFRFGGSEQATPPMMSPQYFEELSARYDQPLFDLVHKYGGIVHVHCHGRVKGIFPRLLEMGVDVLDPMEPPPDGDLTLAEARQMAGDRMTLVGGIEIRDFEFCMPDEIEDKTKRMIGEGGRSHYVLASSDVAITSISDRFRDNAIRFIETGLRYGR